MHERNGRDHRLAMALLTKSRYALPPAWSASKQRNVRAASMDIATSSGDADDDTDAPAGAEEVTRLGNPLKRQAAARSTFAGLQLAKRPRLSSSSAIDELLRSPSKDAIAKRSSPRSLQFAMEGLSSLDTKLVLKTLSELPQEIARLNSTSTSSSGGDTIVAPKVFGWCNAFWRPKMVRSPPPNNNQHGLVIWKATKTFESTDMRPLAKKVWDSTETLSRVPQASKIAKWEILHSISKCVRVVRRVDHLYGREEQETVWLECFLDRGKHVCIGRKQLRHFREYESAMPVGTIAASNGCECEGFLFRPHLTKLKREYMLGSTLQCTSSVATRELSPTDLVQHIVDDLPRFTLQWEEAVVHDLLPQIKY